MEKATTSSTAQAGSRIYQSLREQLEPAHNGKYIVIDVDSGDYEMDADHMTASNRAAAKRPGARLYATRVGSTAIGRIGRSSSPIRS